jgi:hypothetical protein
MTQLSDTQTLILRAVAQRPERIAMPLPESLRGGAAAKVIGAMLAKGFLQEVDADLRKGEPMWRETGDGNGVTLVATDAGFAAIGIEPEDTNTAPVGADGRSQRDRSRAQGAHAARGNEAGHPDRHAARAGRSDHRGDRQRTRMGWSHSQRRHGGSAEEETRARGDLREDRKARKGIQTSGSVNTAAPNRMPPPFGAALYVRAEP